MHAIEVGALGRKIFRNVLVVANVVEVGWGGKARGQQKLTIKLRNLGEQVYFRSVKMCGQAGLDENFPHKNLVRGLPKRT